MALDLPPALRRRHRRARYYRPRPLVGDRAGRRVLKGADQVTLRQDVEAGHRKAARAAANAAALSDGDGDKALFEALRRRRSELAKAQQVPAYVVFADQTLIDMARRKPATVAEMGAVHGVGDAKLRQYGEAFLDVIRQHAAARPNFRRNRVAGAGPSKPLGLLHRIPRCVSKTAILRGARGTPPEPHFQVPL